VTKPFSFEGPRKMRLAQEGLARLASTVDTVIAIPNDRLLSLVPRGTSFFDSFKVADDLLRQAVQGISDIIITPGMINRDFADVKATMVGMGYAMLGTAVASGTDAAVEAAKQAISCPLLEDSRIAGSRGVLINITGSSKLGLHEVHEACTIIREAAQCDEVQINFGVILNESMGDSVKITVIATGFAPPSAPAPVRGPVIPVVRVQEPPAPEPVEEAVYAAPPEPAPAPAVEPEPLIDLDDLDTPAYLRQGTLLN
jgi:cell division protein FtsZ